MTYTFKLSRRLARLRFPTIVALSLLTLSCTAGSDLSGPLTDPPIAITPDSTTVAINQTVQFQAVSALPGFSLAARRRRVVTLGVTPVSSKLTPGGLQLFSATATLSDGATTAAAVTWSATGGTVDASGKYTAGNATGKYRVIARTWNGVADTAVVTIVTLARVMVTPASVVLQPGASQQFTAAGRMSDSSSSPITVTWTASGGTISSTGLYTAGSTAGSYPAVAVQAGGLLADTAAITIGPAPLPPPGVPILPGQSIQAAVDANPAGTTFLIKAGRHVRQSVVPKNGDTFRCEAGAILDGETVTPYAFMRSGPAPNDVRIVGCVIERYAPPAQMGAILAGGNSASDGTSGWIVDSTEVQNNANVGIRLGHRMKVRWSYVHDNGTLGIGGIGDDILVESTEIAYNNPSGAGLGFESGGTKFVLTNRLTLRSNFVHHNQGPGLWLDIDNDAALIEQNRVEDNLQEGIVEEISYSAIIRNNTVRRNGLGDSRRTSWLWGAGIGIHASGGSGVEVYGNVLDGNAQGIALLQQNRGAGRLGEHLVQNVYVHDNTVTLGPGSLRAAGGVQDVGDLAIFTSRNNRFVHNSYVLGGVANPFAWMNAWPTAVQWQGYGQDLTGSFTP